MVRPFKTPERRWPRLVRQNSQLLDDLKVNSQPFYGEIALGNVTMFKVGMFFSGTKLFIGIEGASAWAFESVWGAIVDGDYVAKQLDIRLSDAYNIADLINAQLGDNFAEQGNYQDELCGGDL